MGMKEYYAKKGMTYNNPGSVYGTFSRIMATKPKTTITEEEKLAAQKNIQAAEASRAPAREEYTNPYGVTHARPNWSDQPGGKITNKLAGKAPLWNYASANRKSDLDRDRKYWDTKRRLGVTQSPLQPVIIPLGKSRR